MFAGIRQDELAFVCHNMRVDRGYIRTNFHSHVMAIRSVLHPHTWYPVGNFNRLKAIWIVWILDKEKERENSRVRGEKVVKS